MSEPKWWPKGEIPREQGYYFSLSSIGTLSWDFPKDRRQISEGGGHQFYGPITGPPKDRRQISEGGGHQFYGPITGPPKDPPAIKRFVGTLKRTGETVSGVVVEGQPFPHVVNVWKRIDAIVGACEHIELASIKDIRWLDGEPDAP